MTGDTSDIIQALIDKDAVHQVQNKSKRKINIIKQQENYKNKKEVIKNTNEELARILNTIEQALLAALMKLPKNRRSYKMKSDYDNKIYKITFNVEKSKK